MVLASPLKAEPRWKPIEAKSSEETFKPQWKIVQPPETPSQGPIWMPLIPEEKKHKNKKLIWKEVKGDEKSLAPEEAELTVTEEKKIQVNDNQQAAESGLRWPNGQLMSEEDQIHYTTAYSRGSMIQIGDTVYPNLGFNALQRHPESWINAAIIAIDDSRVTGSVCETGDFLDSCADALLETRVRLWNSPAFSFDLHWTMHSLSGEGSPFNFTVGDQIFGADDEGTAFGDGQSLGFVLSKNFGKTFGLTFAGYRLFHLDEKTDLPRNFAMFGTKVFLLDNSLEPPIISLSLGLMTDVFNTKTNIGTIEYPEYLRGGLYPSLFAEYFDPDTSGYVYYSDVAGVSSAFVCADRSIFSGKPITAVTSDCLHQVYIGPIASIGFAPWPWLGMYAKYGGTAVDLGISIKPFKSIPWTISIEALNPIKGVNEDLDLSFDFKECRNRENSTFSDCRTRVGIYTELAF